MRDLLVGVLDTLGVGTIYTAPDGEKGFEMHCRHRPDIVLADWHMVPLNGIDLTRRIRNHPLSHDRMTPIILVTGYSALLRVAQARDAGVTEFIVKPFSANDIAKRIAYVINKPRDFIHCPGYFGPDRRRRRNMFYDGPLRRQIDERAERWEVG